MGVRAQKTLNEEAMLHFCESGTKRESYTFATGGRRGKIPRSRERDEERKNTLCESGGGTFEKVPQDALGCFLHAEFQTGVGRVQSQGFLQDQVRLPKPLEPCSRSLTELTNHARTSHVKLRAGYETTKQFRQFRLAS